MTVRYREWGVEQARRWIDKLLRIWGWAMSAMVVTLCGEWDIGSSQQLEKRLEFGYLSELVFFPYPLFFYCNRSILEIFPGQHLLKVSPSFLSMKINGISHSSIGYYWSVYKNNILFKEKKSIKNNFIIMLKKWKHQTHPLVQPRGSGLEANKKI